MLTSPHRNIVHAGYDRMLSEMTATLRLSRDAHVPAWDDAKATGILSAAGFAVGDIAEALPDLRRRLGHGVDLDDIRARQADMAVSGEGEV